jgi:hypothetical protein
VCHCFQETGVRPALYVALSFPFPQFPGEGLDDLQHAGLVRQPTMSRPDAGRAHPVRFPNRPAAHIGQGKREKRELWGQAGIRD